VFKNRDGVDILISIQSDREWRGQGGAGDAALAADPVSPPMWSGSAPRPDRWAGRRCVPRQRLEALTAKLAAAEIAFARVSDMAALAVHPHLHGCGGTPSGDPPDAAAPAHGRLCAVPAVGEHTERCAKSCRRCRSKAAHR
jgi:formyl-CoA transferase